MKKKRKFKKNNKNPYLNKTILKSKIKFKRIRIIKEDFRKGNNKINLISRSLEKERND